MAECKICDFENALNVSRATWLCPKCGRDFSLEYLFWYKATHPECFCDKRKTDVHPENKDSQIPDEA